MATQPTQAQKKAQLTLEEVIAGAQRILASGTEPDPAEVKALAEGFMAKSLEISDQANRLEDIGGVIEDLGHCMNALYEIIGPPLKKQSATARAARTRGRR